MEFSRKRLRVEASDHKRWKQAQENKLIDEIDFTCKIVQSTPDHEKKIHAVHKSIIQIRTLLNLPELVTILDYPQPLSLPYGVDLIFLEAARKAVYANENLLFANSENIAKLDQFYSILQKLKNELMNVESHDFEALQGQGNV